MDGTAVYLAAEVEDMVHSIVDRVKVAEASLHIVVAHLAFHHPEFGVYQLAPKCFA